MDSVAFMHTMYVKHQRPFPNTEWKVESVINFGVFGSEVKHGETKTYLKTKK